MSAKHVKLKEIAYGRSGDKGDISNVGIIPYRGEDLDLLRERLTVEHMERIYEDIVHGDIERYEFDGIKALNFVMYEALDGGVSRSLNLDTHGKSMHAIALHSEIEVHEDYEPPAVVDGEKQWIRQTP